MRLHLDRRRQAQARSPAQGPGRVAAFVLEYGLSLVCRPSLGCGSRVWRLAAALLSREVRVEVVVQIIDTHRRAFIAAAPAALAGALAAATTAATAATTAETAATTTASGAAGAAAAISPHLQERGQGEARRGSARRTMYVG